jgi:hypothetical protein
MAATAGTAPYGESIPKISFFNGISSGLVDKRYFSAATVGRDPSNRLNCSIASWYSKPP